MNHERVRAAFDAAFGRPEAEWTGFFAGLGLTAEERAEAESLLRADAASEATDPLAARVGIAAQQTANRAEPGQVFGVWRVTGTLGEGGMGVVLAAERGDGAFRQRAAIKLIRGWSSPQARDRLRRERQILAELEHPGIARLIDGGDTPGGEPYLVMEFIDGQPLSGWLATDPPLVARVRLVARLCEAVAYAHQHLVVHRDLKPGNVLVRADGTPVLLDFGIARLVDEGEHGEATRTQSMTPSYAAPEQLRGGAVTTATDIFGLGMLLYMVLSGRMKPRRMAHALDAGTVDPLDVVAREAPWPGFRADAARLRGDLEAIVRKAMREDPAARYATAAALKQDIQCWLDGLPVSARADDRWYAVRTFVRRHRLPIGFGTAAVLALVVFTVQLAIERDRARTAQAAAQAEAAATREVLSFVTGLFGHLDPRNGGRADRTALDLLDLGREQLAALETSEPETRARLQHILGEIYRNSERAAPAIELLESARATFAGQPAFIGDLDRVELALSQAQTALQQNEAAITTATGLLARHDLAQPTPALPTAHALTTRGLAFQQARRESEALADFAAAERIFALHGEAGANGLAAVKHNRGLVALAQARPEEALSRFREAAALKQRLLPADHPSTLVSEIMVARSTALLGRLSEAVSLQRALLPRIEAKMGPRSGFYVDTLNDMASNLQDFGDYEASAAAYARAQAAAEVAGDPMELARVINNRATLAEDRGDLAAAKAGYRASLAIRLDHDGEEALSVARARHNLARALLSAGHVDEAEPLVERAGAVRSAALPEGHAENVQIRILRLDVCRLRGDRKAGAPVASALEGTVGNTALPTRTRAAIHRALARWAGPGEAAAAHLRAARALVAQPDRPDHPFVALIDLELAMALASFDRPAAGALAGRIAPILDRALVPEAPQRQHLAALRAL